ncbi:MAG TPA: class I adenylate-forming enzyme family protein [Syntrophales bacterium]|nr:class I adenylate-forming enzyme family protein [Syntrophales bacterium]HPQ44465.1 class I adenylate-forming enzyme family protein [Syntrophales bacterium]
MSEYVPIMFERKNLLEYFTEVIKQYPDRTAVVTADGSVRKTYGEVNRRANRLARYLARLGVGKGDRVAIFQNNCWQYPEQYLAILKLGAICVPMNFRLKSPEALFILNESGAKTLIVENRYVPIFEPTLSYQLGVKNYLCTGGGGPEWAVDYETALSQESEEDPAMPDLTLDDIVAICFTSGTTGLPKGSISTHRQIMTNFYGEMGELIESTRHPDLGYHVIMMIIPVYHIAGIMTLYLGMKYGSTIVISADFVPEAFMQTVEREQITLCYLVPIMFFFIINDPSFGKYNLGSLRFIPYGAMPMDPALLQDILKKFPPGIKYMDAFGSTEVVINIAKLPDDHDLSGSEEEVGKKIARLKSVGRPFRYGIESTILDPFGKELTTGEVGEIVSRGEKVTVGYWRNPEATAMAFDKNGWFHTGDAGWMDEDGYVYFADRAKDMINRGGENIFPVEVERRLNQHSKVAESAVFGVPDPAWGSRVVAAVVLAPGETEETTTQEELIGFCKEQLASYKAPSAIWYINQLPRRFELGKVLRFMLRDEYMKKREEIVT